MRPFSCLDYKNCKYYNEWNRCYPDCFDYELIIRYAVESFMKTEEDIMREGYKHGDRFECPLCGAPGRLDIDTPAGEQPEFELSVWYNVHIPGWECSECWLK